MIYDVKHLDNLPGYMTGECCRYCEGPLRNVFYGVEDGQLLRQIICIWCEDPRTKRLQKIVNEAKSMMPDFSFPDIQFEDTVKNGH